MKTVRNILLASSMLMLGSVICSAAPGDLYSGQLSGQKILRFTPAGVASTFTSGIFADSLAFDASGNLYSADTQGRRIIKVAPDGTQSVFATNVDGNGLAFNSSGILFASDATSGSVFAYNSNGSSSTFATGLNGPAGLAFDSAGNFYVSESNPGDIVKITPSGSRSVFASGLSTPLGLAFDPAGNLYEADFSGGKIDRITPAGQVSTFTTNVSGPRQLAFDSSGYLYEANYVTQEIRKFDSAADMTVFASGVNAGGLAFEPTVNPTPTPTPSGSPTPTPGRLANLSTRGFVGTGNGVIIGGFVIQGSGNKTVAILGIGPGSGAPSPLQDPQLRLIRPNGNVDNDNWQQVTNPDQMPANQLPQSLQKQLGPNDAAIMISLPPGAYTAILSGVNNSSGGGQVAIYDVDNSHTSYLANVSTRGFVGNGDQLLIGGLVISGNSCNVFVDAKGPVLGDPPNNLTGYLADPVVRLFDVHGNQIDSNDNWKQPVNSFDATQAQIQATGHAPTHDSESALIRTLPPGAYTAIVSGVGGTSGLGEVEIFKLD